MSRSEKDCPYECPHEATLSKIQSSSYDCPYGADECPKISALAKDLKSLKNMTLLITIVIVYYHGVEIMKWFV